MVMVLTPVACKCLIMDSHPNAMQLLSSVLFCMPLFFAMHAIRRRWISAALLTILMSASAIETIQVMSTGNYLLTGNLLAITGTTPDEAVGFMKGILPVLPFCIPVVLAYAGCIVTSGRYSSFRRLYDMVGVAASSVLIAIFIFLQMNVKWQHTFTLEYYMRHTLLGRPPYNTFCQMAFIPETLNERRAIRHAEGMTFNASRPDFDAPESYCLYIGESLRYDNLSLGGYSRTTTPLLETLDGLILYSDYYSTANLTMFSIPQIITRATADDFSLNYREKSILAPFRECGFRTFVISSDNLLSHEAYLSEGCDEIFIMKTTDDGKVGCIVDSLVNIYPKTFFVLDVWGNHEPYTNFSVAQDIYHPNPVSDNASWTDHQAKVNAYDNTVLFTDFVAHSVITAIDKPGMQSAFMLVSDHGADYDLGAGVNDHGFNCSPRRSEYHVPFIFWASGTWRRNHAGQWGSALRHKDMPVNADNVFYTLCDMADITTGNTLKGYEQAEWSVLSDSLKVHERKLLCPDGKTTIIPE